MLGQNTIIEIEQIIDLSISASNRTLIRSIKDNITRRAKESFKKIFKNFTINVIPEIIIDDQQFQIVIRADEKRHYATSVTKYQSSGFKAFLWLVIMLEVVKNWEKNKFGRVILLVDEPDKSLHIILQYELAKYLKTNFTSKNGLFILLTSHSPFLIPNLKENIYIADMTEKGYTELTKAENINNIRNAGIFPLITLFHMEKIQKEIFSTGENQVRIYYELKMDRSKAIEEALNEIIQNKFEYSIVPINSNERKHIFDIRINNFFSKHI
ncbi:AAA family ATPase [Spiroplasma endosymbiont of Dasysyrphus albostriatus]|uniref:AAA family ATPase n=1 Tax=Spiroplasma endosymbiont of Dasysyrphus albostriatus TaxID=3066299 RepID=UPI0030D54947